MFPIYLLTPKKIGFRVEFCLFRLSFLHHIKLVESLSKIPNTQFCLNSIAEQEDSILII